MRIWYIKRMLKYLNNNYSSYNFGGQTIWYNTKDKIVALWDNGDIEVIWDIFKEGILKP